MTEEQCEHCGCTEFELSRTIKGGTDSLGVAYEPDTEVYTCTKCGEEVL